MIIETAPRKKALFPPRLLIGFSGTFEKSENDGFVGKIHK
jgi:hypothetical protein